MGPLLGATECQAMFPGFDIYGLAANVVFTVPFWRSVRRGEGGPLCNCGNPVGKWRSVTVGLTSAAQQRTWTHFTAASRTLPWPLAARHFIAWLGSVPATTSAFKRVLRRGSVAVIVGGIAEMYMQDDRKEQVGRGGGGAGMGAGAGVGAGMVPDR